MSKKQSYYICLTKDPHVAINVKVDSVVEMEKAERLFKVLINKCQSSLENSSTPQEFFEELRANMEKFSEFTDFLILLLFQWQQVSLKCVFIRY